LQRTFVHFSCSACFCCCCCCRTQFN